MEQIISATQTIADPSGDLDVQLTPAIVVQCDGVEVIYFGGHGGIPPWIWESL